MAKHFTGADGALYVGGTRIAKVRNWSISGSVETLNVTRTDDTASKFIYGRQSYSGSCTAYYYEDDASALEMSALLSNIIRTTGTTATATATLLLELASNRQIQATVLFTQADISATTGDIVSVNLSFVVTGNLTVATMGAA
jgi:hypothetical protein